MSQQRKNFYLLSGLALFLTGCGSGAFDAAHPFSNSPSAPYANWSPMKGNTLISSQYCQTVLPESFGKNALSLAEMLDIALQNNPLTKQTWAQARAAAGLYGQSLSAFYPNIQFNGTYLRARSSTGGSIGLNSISGIESASSSSSSESGLSPFGTGANTVTPVYSTVGSPDVLLTFTLFDFGVRSSAAEMARQALYYADWTHNQEIQNVLQTVMHGYYNYLYQLAILHSSEANLENAQASLDAANQRFALGLAALGDVAQARTQYLQQKINLTSQKQSVENAFAMLAVDLGLPANIPFNVQQLPDQIAVDPMLDSLAVLVDRAQRQRQDFLASQANVCSKQAGVRLSQAQRFPILSCALDVGRAYFQKGVTDKYHWSGELSLSFPLFAGFYYVNGVRVAKSNLDLAKAQMLQTELSVIQAVTTSHMGVQTAAQNLRFSEEYLQAAELEFDIALQTYKAGTATILDVTSAQSTLADARTKQAGAQYDWFSSLATLAYATGSLCCPPCEENSCP